jgi:hypothetical protein
MKNDPEKSLKDAVVEDFCEPLQGRQKEDCANYYEGRAEKEEEREQIEEQE